MLHPGMCSASSPEISTCGGPPGAAATHRATRDRPLPRRKGGLRPPITGRAAEVPVVDVVAAAVPLVGPGEDEGAGAARREGQPHLPLQRRRLARLAVASAVESYLGDDEG